MNVSMVVPDNDAPYSNSTPERTTTIAEWLCRIRAEYVEVPGLSLTRQQAKRLWRLDDVLCDSVLQALVDVRFLRRTPAGSYIRAD